MFFCFFCSVTTVTKIENMKNKILQQQPPEATESRIQQDILKYYYNTYCLTTTPNRSLIFAIPNALAQKQFGIGVLKGVSDLLIIHRTSATNHRTIFAEVKTPIGKQSPAQRLFETRIGAISGVEYCIVRSVEDMKKIIENNPTHTI